MKSILRIFSSLFLLIFAAAIVYLSFNKFDIYTSACISIILIVFILAFIHFNWLFYKTCKSLKAIEFKYRSSEINDESSEKDIFNNLIKSYKRTIIHNLVKTAFLAEDFFDDEAVISANQGGFPGLKVAQALPNTFVGLGILGTFIGLTIGISNLRTDSSEIILSGINTLMNGINTAFYTSIAGIACSIIFNFMVLLPGLKNVSLKRSEFCKLLDDKYYVPEISLLHNLFVNYDQEDGALLPGKILGDTLIQAKKHTAALSSFSTDLADHIKNMSEQMLDKYNDEIYQFYRNVLEPVLNKIENAANNLLEEKKESATEVIRQIVENLQKNMTDMLSEFKNSVTGDTMMELESLCKILNNAGDSFQSIPDLLETTRKNQELNTQQVEEMIFSVKSLLESFYDQVNISQDMIKSLTGFHQKFVMTLNEQETLHNNLITASEAISNSTKDLMITSQNISEERDKLYGTINEVGNSLENSYNHFKVAEQSIGEIFKQINSGLLEYKEVIETSLESYLSQYSDSLKTFADRLAGASEIVGDAIQELNETLQSNVLVDKAV